MATWPSFTGAQPGGKCLSAILKNNAGESREEITEEGERRGQGGGKRRGLIQNETQARGIDKFVGSKRGVGLIIFDWEKCEGKRCCLGEREDVPSEQLVSVTKKGSLLTHFCA